MTEAGPSEAGPSGRAPAGRSGLLAWRPGREGTEALLAGHVARALGAEGTVEVRDAGGGKGKGAFAVRAVRAGEPLFRERPLVAMQHLRRICTARSPQLRTCALPTWQQLKPCPLTQPQRPPSPAPRRTSASRARKLEKAMTTTPTCT